jgi:hypothetical protein
MGSPKKEADEVVEAVFAIIREGLRDACGSSKLNPHGFIGGFERMGTACLHGESRKAERSRSPKANREPVPRCWNRSRCATKSPCCSAAELVVLASAALIACFGSCYRAGGRSGTEVW